jgi:hypothetical protein
MIDLGLNQNKIKEIKYEIKEGKTVIFKLNNSNLEDVEIIEQKKEETPVKEEKEETKEFGLNEIMQLTKPKQLHDYEPISCLKNEKGMQETLEASRHKQWKEDVKSKPQKPSQTGNALFPTENTVDLQDKNFMSKPSCATTNEITTFLKNQKNADLNEDKKFRDKHEKKLVADLLKSKKLIDDYTTKMSAVEKERFLDRAKNNYFKLDPNDEFSRIKTLNDLNNLNANYSSLSSDEPEVRPMSLKEKDDAKLKPIIDAFKETEENETNE